MPAFKSRTRREFLKTLGLGATAAAFPLNLSRCQPAVKKPNIVFILADDLGYGELGCYGQKYIRTPYIDRLAAEGMRFTQHYAGSPVCAPSRCVLLTGKHTGHAYIRNNGRPQGRPHDPEKSIFAGQNPIPDSEITIAELLKQQGYATGAIGKWGLGYPGSSGDPNRQGFDFFYGYNCQAHAHNHYPRYLYRNNQKEYLDGNDRAASGEQYSQDHFIKEARDFIRDNQARPFFLFLPFIIPHLAIQVPDETLNQYKGIIPEAPHEHRGYIPHPFPRAGYAAMITHMDQGIGEILSLLTELDLDEDTLVVFASDNGPTYDRLGGADSDFFESAGLFRGRKGSLYEGGVRVPMIARWKGKIEAGTQTDLISAFWDVMPTLCDLTGAVTPGSIDGISLAPTLLNSGIQNQHESLYWEFPAYGGQQAVRMGEWKAIRTNLKVDGADHSVHLYNLKQDIGETQNLADQYHEIAELTHRIMHKSRIESELFPFPETRSK